jgi:methyltransferase (TIGR00027 family)
MKRVRVFEVDRAETQRLKQVRLARALRTLPDHVVFVDLDFLRQNLAEALSSRGFIPQRKTFFIWEGVTNYLSSETVDATIRFIGSCVAGSVVAFTYIDQGLLDGSGRFSLDLNVVRLLKVAGEPWTFGFYPEELPRYLRERGLQLREDLEAVKYGERSMLATKDQMKAYEFYHVAIAAVGNSGVKGCQK